MARSLDLDSKRTGAANRRAMVSAADTRKQVVRVNRPGWRYRLKAAKQLQFYELFRRRGEPIFYAFDVLWLDGEDLRSRLAAMIAIKISPV